MECKTLYMVYIYNRFGIMGIRFADAYEELNVILAEEATKGRRCKVAERETSTAASE